MERFSLLKERYAVLAAIGKPGGNDAKNRESFRQPGRGGPLAKTTRHRVSRGFLAVAVAAGILGAAVPLRAEEGKGATAAKAVPSSPVQVRLFDAPLQDQDGRNVRFVQDAVEGRIVVVDTFFTSCGLICPILGAIFADLQEMLGDLLDREVRLVSITVDPLTDIPPRLKKYAAQWEARPGWVFLTGEKQNVDHVLEGLGLYSPDFRDHPSAFLVGDVREGKWTRIYGFATPEQLMGHVREFLAQRKAKSP
jgi:protein SCO1/2